MHKGLVRGGYNIAIYASFGLGQDLDPAKHKAISIYIQYQDPVINMEKMGS